MVHNKNSSEGDASSCAPIFWLAAGATAISALTSAGFSVAALASTASTGDAAVGPANALAMYAAARSIPLALVVLFQVGARNVSGLATLAIVMALVQAGDAYVGLQQHDLGKTVGPAVFAILTALAARALRATAA